MSQGHAGLFRAMAAATGQEHPVYQRQVARVRIMLRTPAGQLRAVGTSEGSSTPEEQPAT
ncbi:hypothetical protein J7E83_15985 [Arthrobacter sp. ISL-48]|uniref:hypothetical protein n=1 Tax=Arthrobacter sp. ISL-48 TaxID=2819110 RepID=UPI001BEB65A3|nr:hypothetical protein [Arthrobacter sp. ISL-48]MBT2533593.1 hypothetical protein [Arthrobacter sp. ISL-48]